MSPHPQTILVQLSSIPQSGGIYNYSILTVDALVDQGNETSNVIIFCYSTAVQDELLARFGKRITVIIKPHKWLALSNLLSVIAACLPYLRYAMCRLNPVNRAITAQKADVVFFPNQDYVASFAQPKMLVTIHDLMHRYERRFKELGGNIIRYHLRELRFRSITKFASTIIVDSAVGKSQVIESYNADSKKIVSLPYPACNGEPAKATQEHQQSFINLPLGKYFFYPAQFWKHKNHERLLQALRLLVDKGFTVPLVLSGHKSKEYENLRSLTERLNLTGHVYFVGYRTADEVAFLYQNCRGLVFPTLIGPTNIPPLEALCHGCPVAVSGIYAMPEMLGDAAVYFDPTSAQSIANAIEKLHSDQCVSELRGKQSPIIERFSKETFGTNLRKIVSQLHGDKADAN